MEVAELADETAVRFSDSELVPIVAQSASVLYKVTEEGLVPEGGRVPTRACLNESLSWRLLADWWQLEWREPLMALGPPPTATLKLGRDRVPREADALLASLTDLCDWVERAAEIRFGGLRYAATGAGEVWVVGKQLPSVRGLRFWHYGADVYLPLGQRLEVPLAPSQIQRAIGGRNCLLFREGEWESVPLECIVPLTRAGVRGSQLLEGLS